MKQLILNADDFGMTRGVNEGIIRAHCEGVLTSCTLMAGGAAFEDAVMRAKQNPELGVGCHLVLVGGWAIAPREEISSLADGQGRLPQSLSDFVARVTSGSVHVEEIEREMHAQINRIRAAGIEPTHLDTHKHTHAHPRVLRALGRVAQSSGIMRVRKPVESVRDSCESLRGSGLPISAQLAGALAVRGIAPLLDAILKKFGLLSPDHFLGLAATGHLGPAKLRQLIAMVGDGTTEIMVHPGHCDAELQQAGTRLTRERETELEGLLHPGVRSAIEERGIRLITYREVN